MSSSNFNLLSTSKLEPANFYIALPAAALGDAVQIVPYSRSRSWLRGIIIFGVLASVVGLTIATYVTDESIQNAVAVNRKFSVDEITEDDARNGLCPCQNIWLPWGLFMKFNASVARQVEQNTKAFLEAQCSIQVSQFMSDEATAIAQVAYAQAAAVSLCQQTMLTVVPAIKNQTQNANFVTPTLLDRSAAKKAYTVYVGQTVTDQVRGGLISYAAMKTAAKAVQSSAACKAQRNVTGACALHNESIDLLSDIPQPVASGVALSSGSMHEVSNNVLAAFGNATDPGAVRVALEGIKTIVTTLAAPDWELYKRACKPRYCDVFGKKSGVTRLAQFLTTVGGLWQSAMIIGFLIWILGGFLLQFENFTFLDKEKSTQPLGRAGIV